MTPNVYKKQKTSTSLSPKQNQSAATHHKQLNKYIVLNPPDDDTNNMDIDQLNINLSEAETHTPPPIFIKSSLNYNGFCNAIKTTIGSHDFTCKSNLIHLLKEKTLISTHINSDKKNHSV